MRREHSTKRNHQKIVKILNVILRLGACLVVMFTILDASGFLGAVCRNAVFAAFDGGNGGINWVEEWAMNREFLHQVLESVVWLIAVAVLYGYAEEADLIGKEDTILFFIAVFAAITFASELFSYFAYLLQFLGDAVIAGVTSRSQSVTLINRVSFERWGNVDWIGRFCQGFATTKMLFLIKYGLLKHRWRKAQNTRRNRHP